MSASLEPVAPVSYPAHHRFDDVPVRRRRRLSGGFVTLVLSAMMLMIWPVLCLLPLGAIVLSWWLGVL